MLIKKCLTRYAQHTSAKLLYSLIRWSLKLAIGFIGFLTVLMLLVHLTSPLLSHYREPLTNYLRNTLKIPLSIENIKLTINGITPTLTLEGVRTQMTLGPEFEVNINKVALQLNLIASLKNKSPQLNYLSASNIDLDVILHAQQLDPRDVIYAVLAHLPKLNQGIISNINLNIYQDTKSSTTLILSLPNLSAILNTPSLAIKTDDKYRLQISQTVSTLSNKTVTSFINVDWRQPEFANVYLYLNQFMLNPADPKWQLNAQIWGQFADKELRFAHGTAAITPIFKNTFSQTTRQPTERIPFDLRLWGGGDPFFKINYQMEMSFPFGTVDAKIQNNQFTLQSNVIDLKKLDAVPRLPAQINQIVTNGVLNNIKLTGSYAPLHYNFYTDATDITLHLNLEDKTIQADHLNFKITAKNTPTPINNANQSALKSIIKMDSTPFDVSGTFFKTPLAGVLLQGEVLIDQILPDSTPTDPEAPALSWRFSPTLKILHDQVDASINGYLAIKSQNSAEKNIQTALKKIPENKQTNTVKYKNYQNIWYANLHTQLQPLDIIQVKRYLPQAFLPEKVNRWLEEALDKGIVDSIVDFKLKGHLAEFTKGFPNNSGLFDIRFSVKDATLHYLPDFPILTQLAANINFHNHSMLIQGTTDVMRGVRTGIVAVSIEDFKHSILKIQGTVDGTLKQFQSYINKVSILKSIATILNDFQSTNKNTQHIAQLNIGINVPLTHESQHKQVEVNGNVQVNGADITYVPLQIDFKKVIGNFLFTEHGLMTSKDNISVAVFNAPALLQINRSDEATQFSLQTKNQLRPFIQHFVPIIADSIQESGAANITTVFTVPHHNPLNGWQYNASSDLKGLQINAPYGLDKSKNTVNMLTVKINPDTASKAAITSSIPKNKDVGSNTERPKLISVQLDNSLSFQASLAQNLKKFDLKIETDQANGNINYTYGKSLVAKFQLLVLPDNWRFTPQSTDQILQNKPNKPTDIKLASMPDLDINVMQLYRSNYLLGRLSITGKKNTNNWQIAPISLTSDALNLNAALTWDTNNQVNNTNITAKLSTRHPDTLNQLLGSHLGMTGIMNANIEGNFPSAPNAIQLTKMNGDFRINVMNGNIPANNDEPLKIMSALNISTFLKRLSFNFNDLLKKGLNYDAFQVIGSINSGMIQIEQGTLGSSSIDIKVQGNINLRDQKYTLDAIIIPKVSSIIPMVGTAAGGPVVGGGLLVVERLLSNQINAITAFKYTITGSLSGP